MPEFKKHTAGPSKASEYTLDEADVARIIDATQSLRDKIIIELLAFTGGRRYELCLLRVKDIDFPHERIFMPTAKQGTNPYNVLREIPFINNNLKRDLQSYIELLKAKHPNIGPEDKLVPLTTTMVSIIVRDTAERAGVKSSNPRRKWIQPHIFRHTFVRYARKCGMDYVSIQEIVGHADISTTMGMYGRPTWADKVTEAKKMEKYSKG